MSYVTSLRPDKMCLCRVLTLLVFTLGLMIGVKPAYAASLTCAPASGAVGASVTVTGSAFLPNTQITILYDGVQATSCTSSAAGAFTASLLIPPSVRGAHTITAQDGTNTATTTHTVTASFTRAPISGAVDTTITLTGYGFASSTAVTVTWDGSALTTSPTPLITDVKGSLIATVTVPNGGPVTHTISCNDGIGTVSQTYTITRGIVLSPVSGSIGTAVSVTGSGFPSSSNIIITFNGEPVATTPTSITSSASGTFTATFTIPSVTSGAKTVRASDNVGGSATATFTVTTSVSLSVTTGRVGTAVTVTGAGFAPSSTVTIKYDDASLLTAPTDLAGGFVQVITIPNSPAGPHTVSAVDDQGVTGSAAFTVTPSITVYPTSGIVGSSVVVTGAGYSGGSTITITFAGTPVSTTPSIITTDQYGAFTASFAAPNNPAGGWSVRAQDSSGLQSVATYTITTKLTLSSTTGTVGTVVTAKGAGFAANSQITLTFDSTTLTTTPLSVVSDANGRFEASFTIPESMGQAHTIMASDAAGGRVSATCTVIPFILLSPNNGRVGSNVVISGTGFCPGGVITITFESGIVATLPPIVEANSMGSFTASFTVPSASPGAKTIRTSDIVGGSAQATYTVTPLITFTATGRAGTAVTVTGTGFAPSNTVSIKFDAVTLVSAPTDPIGGFTQVITVPNAPAGSYLISAIDPLGAAASAAFTVTPLITLSPSSGVVGTVLTINGAGFTASSSIVLTFAGTSMTTTPLSITTDPYGAFTASFAAPNNPTGGWSVRAQDSNGLQSVATYTITTKLTLSSTTGTVGTVVTAKGAGFAAGSQVTLTFDAQTLTTIPSTIFADPSGRFEASFPIPESTGQVHTIVASDTTGNRLSSSYTVSASIKLSPTSGNIGESILLTGAGFGPASLITVTFNSDMVATTPTTIETSPQGSFTAVFSVLTATPGANTVRATDNVEAQPQRPSQP